MTEEKKEIEKPRGYFIGEVPTEYGKVIAKDGKQIDVLELLVEIANKVERAGLQ